jgi:hypothetical protein
MNADALSITSETESLIEGALAAVRAAARLDDDPVLPPLPANTPRRQVVVLSRKDIPLPSPSEIVRSSASAAPRASANAVATPAARAHGRTRWPWPVVLCGLVASLAAGAAFMASPLGHTTAVQSAATAVQARVAAAVHR